MEKISSYPLPIEHLLPISIANWQADCTRIALLIHDMQHYFLKFFTANTSPVAQVIDNTCHLLNAARYLQIPVFYSAQPGDMTPQQRGLLKSLWGPGMRASHDHKQIVPQLAPQEGEQVLTKWRYSAFFNSPLLSMLHSLKRDQLIICGVYAHIGCLCTAQEAYSNDIETFFIADAVADFSAEKHRLALELAAETCSVVLSTQQLINMLE
ncbi:isochorismatase family protein [Xenorhabdus doucetiae]|uniref:Bifunctional isochorismate lyase/aryl carrier protein n=1 Tax=Xenorhabdus doucetiae TaxID=351671 RepID=A0A068QU04_9GAMM|nr:isochorismatase family protein [Xenorhabdus doucetiae]TYP04077.1 bifunctional isochorismate lyase/aryl carrier protein [Xenorhabdus doucetiae]CDG18136.1 putative isochorismatase [Xenorhabdus doucetiae]